MNTNVKILSEGGEIHYPFNFLKITSSINLSFGKHQTLDVWKSNGIINPSFSLRWAAAHSHKNDHSVTFKYNLE